jgi:hypothetical protein
MLIPALTDLSGDARFFEGNIVDSVSLLQTWTGVKRKARSDTSHFELTPYVVQPSD